MAYTEEDLAVIGGRFTTLRMLEQIPVSTAVARAHSAALVDKFPMSRVDELDDLARRIASMFDEQAERKFDAATGNVAVDSAIRAVKEKTRDIVSAADNAFEAEPEIRGQFHKQGPFGKSVPKIAEKAKAVIALARMHSDALAAWGVKAEDLTSAEEALKALVDADSAQERAVTNLPPKTRELYVLKGQAYLLLKKLARAGRRAFSGDPTLAAQLGLDVLRRKGSSPAPSRTP